MVSYRKLFCICLLGLILTTPAMAGSQGKHYPAEWVELTSPESGCKILQLTTGQADDSGLYFTNDGFLPRQNSLVFASRRTGRWNLFLMNLTTGEFIQLTDGPKVRATGAAVAPSVMAAYYFDGLDLIAVDLQTLAQRKLYALPNGYSPSTLSVTKDGQWIAFSIQEQIPLTTTTDKIYSDMAERFEKKPWSAVILVQADGKGWREVRREKIWLSHTLINPLHPGQILYCQEGEWQKVPQRMWLVNSDGSANHSLRPEAEPADRIGHEFWFTDGVRVGYQCTTATAGKCLGIADAGTGQYQEYPGMNDTHMQANSDGTLFVGDGTAKDPCINLYQVSKGRLNRTILFRHNGTYDQQHYHPHPIFTPDDQAIFFTCNRDGNGNIYLLKLASLRKKID